MDKFITQVIAIDYNSEDDTYKCIRTDTLQFQNMNRKLLYHLLNSKHAYVRNLEIQGNNVVIREHFDNNKQFAVIYKIHNHKYICCNSKLQLAEFDYNYIKSNKEQFIDIRFKGNGIATKSKICLVAEAYNNYECYTVNNNTIPIQDFTQAAKYMIAASNFNTKACMINVCELKLTPNPITSKMICKGLRNKDCEKVIIPNFVSEIESYAFNGDGNIKDVVICNGVNKLPYMCFGYCTNIEHVKLLCNSITIDARAFYNCKKLKNIENTTYIKTLGEEALFGTDIRTFVASEALTRISANTFFGSKIETIDLRNANIGYIGHLAFAGTKYIKAIILPNKLKSLDLSAFDKDFSIDNLIINSDFEIINKHSNPKLGADIARLMATK